MKKVILLLGLCLLKSSLLYSQKVFDIKADYISIGEHGNLRFFKESELEEGELREIDYDFEELYDYEHTLNLASYRTYEPTEIDSLIPVENLLSLDKNGFEEKLYKQYFQFQHRSGVNLLDKFNAYFFTLRGFSTDFRLGSTEYYQYFYFRINQQKMILMLEDEGCILPLESGFQTFLEGNQYGKINHRDLQLEVKKKLEEEFPYREPDFVDRYGYWQGIYIVDSNNHLRELLFGQDVLGLAFDTLYIQHGFIIGRIDEEYQVYNLKLERLSPKNTIGVVTNRIDEYCQIITPKATKWIYKNGEILDSLKPKTYVVCGTVGYYDYVIERTDQQFNLLDRRDKNWIEERFEKILNNLLFPIEQYDKVTFLNGENSLEYDGNHWVGSIYDLPDNPFHFLLLQKDGKYGIKEFIRNEDETLTFKTHLPVEYDEIQFLDYHLPIKFKKDGLYGYYPLNSQEKYKVLEDFNGHFARFKLPNGQKGWLGLDGKEYFSQ